MVSMMDKLTIVEVNEFPKLIVYGKEGRGKTTLASEFPDPVFLQTEKGATSRKPLVTFGKITSFQEAIQCIRDLYKHPHDFKTLAIDSIDGIENLLSAEICKQNNWESITTPKYAVGTKLLAARWSEFEEAIEYLRDHRNMNIVGICHEKIERFDDPCAPSYDMYDLNLQKEVRARVKHDWDTILFINDIPEVTEDKLHRRVVASSSVSNRFIYCQGTTSIHAKNRYDMPEKILYRIDEGYKEISKYFRKTKEHNTNSDNNS